MNWHWEAEFLDELHNRLPGSRNLLRRFDAIRDRYRNLFPSGDLTQLLVGGVPGVMSASNLAVAEVNQLAHILHRAGVKGVVLLLDEAERSNWAITAYRTNRAKDMMLGLGLASANKETGHLKHYGNDTNSHYRPKAPSLIHSIFWFTYTFGLADEIRLSTKTGFLFLETLNHHSLSSIRKKILELYTSAYDWKPNGSAVLGHLPKSAGGSETRGAIRTLVAALDYARLHEGG